MNQSDLAENLTHPKKPVEKQGAFGLVSTIFIVIACLPTCYVVFALTDLPNESTFGTLFALIGLWILFGIGLNFPLILITKPARERNAQEYKKEMIRFKKARYVWDHLYYCHKHDIVFLEGHDEFAEVENTLSACYSWGEEYFDIID